MLLCASASPQRFRYLFTTAAPSPFALVMIDDASAAKYGGFPVDRAVTAQAIDKLAAAGVRGVVLTVF
ncbi:MAG: CHASE2 domain-containing protein [Burkholderiales bacterium]